MNSLAGLPQSADALRALGTWTEAPYAYGTNGQEAVAVKRFGWTCPARSVSGRLEMTLSYFANATVDPRRMNDLAYLAGQEQQALVILEAMVRQAIAGVGYLGLPDPVDTITRAALACVGAWVETRGYPETWGQELADVISREMAILTELRRRAAVMEATIDPERRGWGLAVRIEPLAATP